MNSQFTTALATATAKWKAAELQPRTISEYRRTLARLDAATGGKLLGPDAPLALAEWRGALQTRYEQGDVKAATVRAALATLAKFYKTLGGLNPAAELPTVRKSQGLPRPMPVAELHRLLAVPDLATFDGFQARVLLELYFHALRNFEVAQLTVANVLPLADAATFELRFEGKGGDTGVVGLAPASAQLLARHLLARFAPADTPTWLAAVADAASPGDRALRASYNLLERRLGGTTHPLFLGPGGKQLTVRASDRLFAKLRTQAGLGPQWGPHSLRHSCATELLDNGFDLRTVQEVLRHRDIRSTTRYTAVTKRKRIAAAESLPIPVAML